ncbi:MAG TPA: ABC transporter ATP-binding protein, partial [Gemmatimonadales bacterium]|nr:ABC transporter ATP-binding protein [Gemmatimonadales bacterium]
RQRAALARALARGNDLILLDEPLSNVDRPLRMEIGVELRTILSRAGATAVMVTHDQEEALGLADRVALMDRGQVIQVDRPAEMVARPASRFVADFLAPGVGQARLHLDRQVLPPVA